MSLTGAAAVCFYVFMRTTVELPPALLRAAKARSAERGETLKALLTRAVASELGRHAASSESRGRVTLPLFGHPDGAPVTLSNRDLERALADQDAARADAPRHRRGAGRSR